MQPDHTYKASGTPLPQEVRRRARRILHRLSLLWHIPGLTSLSVIATPALKRSLARFSKSLQRIELGPGSFDPVVFREVVTHEAAHAALAIGLPTRPYSQVLPHGAEWKALMAVAGYPDAHGGRIRSHATPDRTPTPAAAPNPANSRPASPTTVYDHRCPVCQVSRTARAPVPAWRCAACVSAGLPGRLEITRRPARTAHG